MNGLTGNLGNDLGLGDVLRQDTQDLTEEEKKKRLKMMQQDRLLSGLARNDLLGGAGGYPRA